MRTLHVNAKDILSIQKSTKGKDYSVSVKLESKVFETCIKKRSTQPVWNESFDLEFKDSKLYRLILEVTLWRNDKHGQHFIGNLELPLKQLYQELQFIKSHEVKKYQDYSPIWYDLCPSFIEEPFPGRICLGLHIKDEEDTSLFLPESSVDIFQESQDDEIFPYHGEILDDLHVSSQLNRSLEMREEILGDQLLKGIVQLDILKAYDLPSEKRFLRRRKYINPFIIVSFGKSSYKTKVLRRTSSPEWNEKIILPIKNAEINFDINFALYDYSKLRNNILIATSSMKANIFFQNPNEKQRLTLNWSMEKFNMNEFAINPILVFQGNFIPAKILRSNFWITLSKLYDHDENGKLNKVELLSMLESVGSTFTECSIDSIFAQFGHENETELPFEDVAIALEYLSISTITKREARRIAKTKKLHSRKASIPPSDVSNTKLLTVENETESSSGLGSDTAAQNSKNGESECNEFGENIVCLKECPICFKPWKRKHKDIDIITHLAICTTLDTVNIDRIVLGGFLTEEYASRKWYNKILSYIGYGGYSIGKNNANVLVQDRSSGKLVEEKIPMVIRVGIRLIFQNIASNKAVESKMAKNLFSYLTAKQGKKMNDPSSAKVILNFVRYHRIHMEDFQLRLNQFKTFNEFFYRKLKDNARTIASPDERVAVSPADCRISVFSSISEATRLWIKGTEFSICNLLQDQSMAKYYEGGSIAVCRLAPQDYHRFHSPVDGVLGAIIPLPGSYFTVNPMAVRTKVDVFTENTRTVAYILSDHFGKVAYVPIGAMLVGSVNFTTSTGDYLKRMDEIGYFAFGGSTIIVCFAKDKIVWDNDLLENSRVQLETLIKVGDSIGATSEYSKFKHVS